jgi:hypothetical protein
MTPSRQVRRAQERAEAKVEARQARLASQQEPIMMSHRIGYTQMLDAWGMRFEAQTDEVPEPIWVGAEEEREAFIEKLRNDPEVRAAYEKWKGAQP